MERPPDTSTGARNQLIMRTCRLCRARIFGKLELLEHLRTEHNWHTKERRGRFGRWLKNYYENKAKEREAILLKDDANSNVPEEIPIEEKPCQQCGAMCAGSEGLAIHLLTVHGIRRVLNAAKHGIRKVKKKNRCLSKNVTEGSSVQEGTEGKLEEKEKTMDKGQNETGGKLTEENTEAGGRRLTEDVEEFEEDAGLNATEGITGEDTGPVAGGYECEEDTKLSVKEGNEVAENTGPNSGNLMREDPKPKAAKGNQMEEGTGPKGGNLTEPGNQVHGDTAGNSAEEESRVVVTGQNVEEDTEQNIQEDTEQNIEEDTGQNIEEDTGQHIDKDTEQNIEEDTEQNIQEDTEQNIQEDTEQNIQEDTKQNIQEDTEETMTQKNNTGENETQLETNDHDGDDKNEGTKEDCNEDGDSDGMESDMRKVETDARVKLITAAEKAELDRLSWKLKSYTMPSRLDAQNVLQSSARFKWLHIEGITMQEFTDPDFNKYLSLSEYIHMIVDRETDTHRKALVLKFSQVELCCEVKAYVEENLPRHCIAQYIDPNFVRQDFPEISEIICQDLDVIVDDDTFLCVHDLPADATDDDLASVFPFCQTAAVSQVLYHPTLRSMRYGYIIFQSGEELEKLADDQIEWHVNIRGKLCPITYSRRCLNLNFVRTIKVPLHVSERRLALERILIIRRQQELIRQTQKEGEHNHWTLNKYCNMMEQDMALREKERAKQVDNDETNKEATETEKRIQHMIEELLEILEWLKTTDSYQRLSRIGKRTVYPLPKLSWVAQKQMQRTPVYVKKTSQQKKQDRRERIQREKCEAQERKKWKAQQAAYLARSMDNEEPFESKKRRIEPPSTEEHPHMDHLTRNLNMGMTQVNKALDIMNLASSSSNLDSNQRENSMNRGMNRMDSSNIEENQKQDSVKTGTNWRNKRPGVKRRNSSSDRGPRNVNRGLGSSDVGPRNMNRGNSSSDVGPNNMNRGLSSPNNSSNQGIKFSQSNSNPMKKRPNKRIRAKLRRKAMEQDWPSEQEPGNLESASYLDYQNRDYSGPNSRNSRGRGLGHSSSSTGKTFGARHSMGEAKRAGNSPGSSGGQSSVTGGYKGPVYGAGNSAGQTYGSDKSAGQAYGAGNSTGQAYWAGNSMGQTYGAGNSTGQAYGAGNSMGQTYGAGNSKGQAYGAGKSAGQAYGAGKSAGQAYGAGKSAGQAYGTGNSMGQSSGAGNSAGQTYGAGNSAGQAYGAGNSRGHTYRPGNSAGQTYGAVNSTGQAYRAGNSAGQAYGAGNLLGQIFGPDDSMGQAYRVGFAIGQALQAGEVNGDVGSLSQALKAGFSMGQVNAAGNSSRGQSLGIASSVGQRLGLGRGMQRQNQAGSSYQTDEVVGYHADQYHNY